MTTTQDPSTTANAPLDAEKESPFLKLADWVSAAMGRPTNIIIWLVLVVAWCLLFALDHAHNVQHGTFMPAWFTSQGFNFPLNLITTVAELFIGFLVAAASNRSERNLETTLARMSTQEELIKAQETQIKDVETKLSDSLEQNTELTKAVHELAKSIHEVILANQEEIKRRATGL